MPLSIVDIQGNPNDEQISLINDVTEQDICKVLEYIKKIRIQKGLEEVSIKRTRTRINKAANPRIRPPIISVKKSKLTYKDYQRLHYLKSCVKKYTCTENNAKLEFYKTLLKNEFPAIADAIIVDISSGPICNV